ncbi:hypothetical protein Pfo_024399 [Paulownia fortunei]|nr:hypothetical protein Pfo_024399 [Paulownia fortunei]
MLILILFDLVGPSGISDLAGLSVSNLAGPSGVSDLTSLSLDSDDAILNDKMLVHGSFVDDTDVAENIHESENDTSVCYLSALKNNDKENYIEQIVSSPINEAELELGKGKCFTLMSNECVVMEEVNLERRNKIVEVRNDSNSENTNDCTDEDFWDQSYEDSETKMTLTGNGVCRPLNVCYLNQAFYDSSIEYISYDDLLEAEIFEEAKVQALHKQSFSGDDNSCKRVTRSMSRSSRTY